MGLPWDEANVPRNLQVIASLRSGDKLSVLKKGTHPTYFSNLGKGGRGLREIFDRQQGGFWAGKRGLERLKSTYRKSGLQHRRKMQRSWPASRRFLPAF